MLLEKSDLRKVRLGIYRCSSCGTYYDPTYGPCPGCTRKYRHIAVIALMFLLMWLPLEIVKAQVAEPTPDGMECMTPTPEGPQWCMIPPVAVTVTATMTPVAPPLTPFVPTDVPLPSPTNTPRPRPTFTPTPIVITPVDSCAIEACVYMPIIRK